MARGSVNGDALDVDPLDRERARATFLRQIERGDTCWLWTGYANQDGYGRMYIRVAHGTYKLLGVHRLSYRHFKGPIPAGQVVMHNCDNPKCVNPDHLTLGTQKDNLDDMRRKGRSGVSAGSEGGWS